MEFEIIKGMCKSPRKAVEWHELEPHYRAGIRSLKELGTEYGVSDAAIIKHAKKHGWSRNLLAKIQTKADAKVSASVVSAQVSAKKALTERAVVEANVDLQVAIRLGHRKDIARGRKLFTALMDELELTSDNKVLFAQLAELMRDDGSEDDASQGKLDRLNEIYRKVISMPGRVDAHKKLVETLEKLVRMEREAFGIDKEGDTENPIDKALKTIAEMKRNGIRPE